MVGKSRETKGRLGVGLGEMVPSGRLCSRPLSLALRAGTVTLPH